MIRSVFAFLKRYRDIYFNVAQTFTRFMIIFRVLAGMENIRKVRFSVDWSEQIFEKNI